MSSGNIRRPFELVGHINPAHEYPQFVVPVLQEHNGNLVAAYASGGELVPIPRDLGSIVRHVPGLITHYDPQQHGLFAVAPDSVTIYRRDDAGEFLSTLWSSRELAAANPFLKLSMVPRDNIERLRASLRACVLELGLSDEGGFAQAWYESYLSRTDSNLPDRAHALAFGFKIVRIASLPGDEQVLLALSRVANHEPAGRLLLAPFAADWLPADSTEWPTAVSAVLGEVDVSHPPADSIVLGASEVVLLVRPDFAQRYGNANDAESILNAGAFDESFKWIRPRSDTPTGQLLDLVIAHLDEEEDTLSQRLADRVLRYAKFDHDAIIWAANSDQLRCDAIVVKRHAAKRLVQHMTPRHAPQVFSFKEPLYTGIALRWDATRLEQRAVRQLGDLCRSQLVTQHLRQHDVGVDHVAVAVALARRAHDSGRGPERPIAVCLVADISGSMAGEKLETAKQGMITFLSQLSEERADAVGLVTFESLAEVAVPIGELSSTEETIAAQIRSLRPKGGTALLDAVALARRELASWRTHACAIVLLTDGGENASVTTPLDQLLRELRSDDVPPAVLSLAYGADADFQVLQRLAEATRGKCLTGSVRNVVQLYQHAAGLL